MILVSLNLGKFCFVNPRVSKGVKMPLKCQKWHFLTNNFLSNHYIFLRIYLWRETTLVRFFFVEFSDHLKLITFYLSGTQGRGNRERVGGMPTTPPPHTFYQEFLFKIEYLPNIRKRKSALFYFYKHFFSPISPIYTCF